jgi:methionine-S-sulfoxide reductase
MTWRGWLLVLLGLGACQKGAMSGPSAPATEAAPPLSGGQRQLVVAGGCFWCMEPPFEAVAGVVAVESGYTGGPEVGPSYRDVASGQTGQVEAIRVVYNPKLVSLEKLLDVFWRNIDPTDDGGQFVDRGQQYRTAIFYDTEADKRIAEASKKALVDSGRFTKPIVTPIRKSGPFWMAEAYHQDFYKKSPEHYHRYRSGSGRDLFLEKVWGKKDAAH